MRHNFYRDIHKAIRLMLGELSTRAGATDFTDRASVAALLPVVDQAFEILSGHAAHESGFVGPLLAEVRPDVYAAIENAHGDQEEELRALRATLAAVDCEREDAAVRGHVFVLELSRFTAELLAHMSDEEDIIMPALWAACDDAMLLSVHQRLVGSIPPAEMLATMRFMVPAMNHSERVALFGGLQRFAPPAVLAAVLDVARERLEPAGLARLEATLVPGSQRAA